MKNYPENIEKNTTKTGLKKEKPSKKAIIISMAYTFSLFLAVIICNVCDYAISKSLTWSLITLISIFFAWIISFPMTLLGKKGIKISLVFTSIFILPFLYGLSYLTKTEAVFRLGAMVCVIGLIFLWMSYCLYLYFKNRKLFSMGIILLSLIIFGIMINYYLSKKLETEIFNIWDILSGLLIFAAAIIMFVLDYIKLKGKTDGK
ncbi:hypothetical protein SAMN05216249_10574 [Acetitomaculum ruminis DSM 5522]|uniref:Uncharacterized protein n=1 Tax=Acetitomaculum ruminis DSM 5522 TaxID=1120918 RepID=A0A1I0WZP5_9FIRM|nr:hypothetical protein [Acetitomaculum ruminis]SFA93640.1 hypothetical protein SAMN05216249_10574 [Acetitomaculum ruminis DSM 5522]